MFSFTVDENENDVGNVPLNSVQYFVTSHNQW